MISSKRAYKKALARTEKLQSHKYYIHLEDKVTPNDNNLCAEALSLLKDKLVKVLGEQEEWSSSCVARSIDADSTHACMHASDTVISLSNLLNDMNYLYVHYWATCNSLTGHRATKSFIYLVFSIVLAERILIFFKIIKIVIKYFVQDLTP